jgi:23S rRNA pseudouridine2605 synthase
MSKPRHGKPERKKSRPKHRGFSNRPPKGQVEEEVDVIGMRLNKYVAKSGVCSRRQAAEEVKAGNVKVNDKVVVEPFYQIQEGDLVTFKDRPIKPETVKVYYLLNKPKNTITTVSDDRGRKTVMDLLPKIFANEFFPVGRLDRATTGLLILTNDGDLAKKLSHPSHKVKKAYHVVLDKPVAKEHIERIREGLMLEDGPVKVDEVDYVKDAKKTEVGVVLHLGRNRIVRRIFEHLGYDVRKLDRTYYAGLTKKDLPAVGSAH